MEHRWIAQLGDDEHDDRELHHSSIHWNRSNHARFRAWSSSILRQRTRRPKQQQRSVEQKIKQMNKNQILCKGKTQANCVCFRNLRSTSFSITQKSLGMWSSKDERAFDIDTFLTNWCWFYSKRNIAMDGDRSGSPRAGVDSQCFDINRVNEKTDSWFLLSFKPVCMGELNIYSEDDFCRTVSISNICPFNRTLA